MEKQRLNELIHLGEGHTLEFKREGTTHLARDICAMANAIGGKIIIGVDDNGTVTGVSKHNKLKSEVQSMARNMDPSLALAVESLDSVVVITVPESASKPHSVNGRYYLRQGANSQLMNRAEIKDFFFQEGLVFFDEMLNPKYDLERDFPVEKYQNFLKQSGIYPDIDRVDALENLKMIRSGRMSNAGTLLLCERVTDFLISATISCVLFQANSTTKVLDHKVFDEDLYTNYQKAIAYLIAHLNTEYIIKWEREEKLEIPENALREAVLNAIAHRDYRSTGNIQISIFKDQVVIVNPGGLVAGL